MIGDDPIYGVVSFERDGKTHSLVHANIAAKSVCDFADSAKSDDYRRFAAYATCEFAKFLYEKILPSEGGIVRYNRRDRGRTKSGYVIGKEAGR